MVVSPTSSTAYTTMKDHTILMANPLNAATRVITQISRETAPRLSRRLFTSKVMALDSWCSSWSNVSSSILQRRMVDTMDTTRAAFMHSLTPLSTPK